MNNEEWGVTERGFHRPTYVELLNAIEYKARELFGDRANLTVRSPLGLLVFYFSISFRFTSPILPSICAA